MKLKEIMSISGKGGLFKFISQARNGIIVESFEDKKRFMVHSSAKVSALEDIAIYTKNDELPLADVLKKIYEKEEAKKTISHKSSSNELTTYFESILPDYDRERVYVSDIKKIIHWYNLLIGYDLLHPEEEKEKEKEKKEEKGSGDKEKEAKAKTTKPGTKDKKPAGGVTPKGASTKPKTVKPPTPKSNTKQK